MSTILSGLAQAPVENESIWDIFEFERNLSQVCGYTQCSIRPCFNKFYRTPHFISLQFLFYVKIECFSMEKCYFQIWQETTDDEDNPNSTYTVGELYKLWPYVRSFQCQNFVWMYCPLQHDWLGVLKGVLGPSGVDISLSSNVTVGTPEYFKRLTQLVEATDNE